METNNFKKKKLKLSTNQQQESYEHAKICYIYKQNFEDKYTEDKKCHIVREDYHHTREYRGAAHSICNLKYSVPKEILIGLHNVPNYDKSFYHKSVRRRIWRTIYLFKGKYWKILNFFSSTLNWWEKERNHRNYVLPITIHSHCKINRNLVVKSC